MEAIKRNKFLSGFSNENIIEEFYVSNNVKLKPVTILSENKENYKIEIGIPYMRKEDISVGLRGNTLIINAHCILTNSSGKESRNYKGKFKLPKNIQEDEITAIYEDDLLAVHLPKEKSNNIPKQ